MIFVAMVSIGLPIVWGLLVMSVDGTLPNGAALIIGGFGAAALFIAVGVNRDDE